jgi:hypothetical protein
MMFTAGMKNVLLMRESPGEGQTGSADPVNVHRIDPSPTPHVDLAQRPVVIKSPPIRLFALRL